MRLGLLPKESPFFGVLHQHVALVEKAAVQFDELVRTFQDVTTHLETLKQLRREGGDKAHEMTTTLSRSFVTPIDREDLHLLSSSLDRVLGYISGTADKMVLYRITAPNQWILQQADTLKRITAVLVAGFQGLSKFADITPLWQQVKDLEREGDRLVAEAIADLFDGEHAVLQVIKWKEIHEDVEEAIDRCEDVFDVLETVLVKHA